MYKLFVRSLYLVNPSENETWLFNGAVITKLTQIFHDSWTMKTIINVQKMKKYLMENFIFCAVYANIMCKINIIMQIYAIMMKNNLKLLYTLALSIIRSLRDILVPTCLSKV